MLCLSLASALCACGNKDGQQAKDDSDWERFGITAEQAEQTIAKVGEREITVGEFALALESQGPYLRQRFRSPARRREFLKLMVDNELLALEAKRLKLDKGMNVESAAKRAMAQAMLDSVVDSKVKREDITNAMVRAYYQAHPAEYNKPEQVRLNMVSFGDRAAALKAHKAIKEGGMPILRSAAKAGGDANAGDTGFISRQPDESEDIKLDQAVREAAFGLKAVGDVCAEPVKNGDKYVVFALAARRAAFSRKLEDVAHVIKEKLWLEKREKERSDFIASLKKKADIKIDEKALDSLASKKDKSS